MVIVLIIIALIAGYFFVKKYNKIDSMLFSSVKDYQPFGITIVYVAAFAGAVFGCLYCYKELIDESINLENYFQLAYMIFTLVISASIYQTFLMLNGTGAIIAKSLWMLVSCVLAAVIGFAGSVVVIAIVMILLILVIFGKMALGSGNTYKIKDEDGNTHTMTDGGLLFGQRDESGHEWEHTGGNEYRRKY